MKRVEPKKAKPIVNPYAQRRKLAPQPLLAKKKDFGELFIIPQAATKFWKTFVLPPGVRTGLQIEDWYINSFPSVEAMPPKSLYDATRLINGKRVPCEIKVCKGVPSKYGRAYEFRASYEQHRDLKNLKELDVVFLLYEREKDRNGRVTHNVSITHGSIHDVKRRYST